MWKALVVGMGLGYGLNRSQLPPKLLTILTTLPKAESLGSLVMVIACLLLVYGLVFALLWTLASKERNSYTEIDESIKTSFRANLRKRGSFGHLEFLQGLPIQPSVTAGSGTGRGQSQ